MKKLKAWQIVLLVIFYPVGICVLIYRLVKKSKLKREAEEREKARAEESARKEAERAAARAKEEAYRASVNRELFRVVGVTFDNRQAILKRIKKDEPDARRFSLRRFEFEGEPAVGVYFDGEQVGSEDVLTIINAGRAVAPLQILPDDTEKVDTLVAVEYLDEVQRRAARSCRPTACARTSPAFTCSSMGGFWNSIPTRATCCTGTISPRSSTARRAASGRTRSIGIRSLDCKAAFPPERRSLSLNAYTKRRISMTPSITT